jgi:hypothetical protein
MMVASDFGSQLDERAGLGKAILQKCSMSFLSSTSNTIPPPSLFSDFMNIRKFFSASVTHGSDFIRPRTAEAMLRRLVIQIRSTKLLRISAVFRISDRASSGLSGLQVRAIW